MKALLATLLGAVLILIPSTPALGNGHEGGDFVVDAGHSDGARSTISRAVVGNFGQGKDLNGNPFATPMVFQVRIALSLIHI